MPATSSKQVVVLAITVLAVLGWAGVGTVASLHSGSSPAASTAFAHASNTATPPSVASVASAVTVGAPGAPAPSETALDSQAVAATRAAGLRSNVVYLPRASANPAEIAQEHANGVVSSFYTTDPAPMGLAYYGTSGNGKGLYTGGILNTTSLLGYVDPNATGIQGADLYQSVPDAFSIQLNAVLTYVYLFGDHSYSFWAQAVATYYPVTGVMLLVSNVWNFSAVGAKMSSNSIFAHGEHGYPGWGNLGYYFSSDMITYRVSYPFTLELGLTSSLADGRDNVDFSAFLSSPNDAFPVTNGTFDYVTFNSIPENSNESLASPANFTANGLSLNPAGLPDDFELDIVGPGAGSQVDFATADATLGLLYLTSGTPEPTYEAVPSAYSYGGDTAETSTGANIAWTNASTSIISVSPSIDHGTMTTGPSILTGLWGLGAPEGTLSLTLDVNPANAFDFLSFLGTADFTSSFSTQFEYAPDLATNTFYLIPGEYDITSELADHLSESEEIEIDASIVIEVDLKFSTDAGAYTPLWAFNNAEVAAISQSGSGTAEHPYLLDNNQEQPISATFGLYNDRGFPVFPGLFLEGTNVSVELNDSFDFLTDTSDTQAPGENLSPTNNLQMWLWNVTNFALNNSNISGWFADLAYYPLDFNTFNVVFYESQHNLVSDNYFLTQSQGLLMYANGTFFGPDTRVGGNNTVWGNDFVQVTPPVGCPDAPCFAYLPYSLGLGAEIGEDFDLIYNNQFDTPTTAWLLPLNLYTSDPATYEGDSWNITTQPASDTNYDPSFPMIPLHGSVVGSSSQGGNSWWDFGVTQNWANDADNPTTVLPYDENAYTLLDPAPGFGLPLTGYPCGPSPPDYYCASYIHPNGDFAPLPTVAAAVDVEPAGTIPGFWGASLSCSPPVNPAGAGPPINIGGGGAPSAGTTGTVCCGALPINIGGGGAPSACDPPARVLADFVTNSSSFDLVLPDGEYNVTPYVPPGYASVAPFTINVTTGPTIPLVLQYSRASWNVTFTESGLPAGAPWYVNLTTAAGAAVASLSGTTSTLMTSLVDGTYDFTVATSDKLYEPSAFPPNPCIVNGAPVTLTGSFVLVTYPVTFTESGLPAGDLWYANLTTAADAPVAHLSGGTTSLSTNLPNGTYYFSIATNDKRYEPSTEPPNPCIVNGAPVTLTLSFVLLTYPVTFTESGLPAGDLWYVNLTTAASAPVAFLSGSTASLSTNLPNGTYYFSIATNDKRYEPSTEPPNPCIVEGQPVALSVAFTLVTYAVTFTEAGLPSGTSWNVTLGTTTFSSTGTTITFEEPNGSYSYTVGSIKGYVANPSSGSIHVAGAPVKLSIALTQPAITVSPGRGPVGATVRVSGTGFSAASLVGLVFDAVTISSCTKGSLTTGSTGAFNCTFTVPSGTSGTTVLATNAGGQTATTTFTVTSLKLSVSPTLGPKGATVTVSGTGYSVASLVGLVFDAVTISSCTGGSLTTGSTGAFNCTFTVPGGTSGTTVTATDVGGQKMTASFTVTTPVIAVVPGQGPVGASVAVAGAGFSVSSKVSLVFDGVTVSSCTLGSLTTNSLGLFGCTFKVPSHTSGTTVTATDVGGAKASTSFTVTTPAITVSPSSGLVGASVTVSGTGFSVASPVGLVFDGVTISSCTSGSLTTGSTGAFSCTFKVPSHTSGTTVTATDVGGAVAVGKFTVT